MQVKLGGFSEMVSVNRRSHWNVRDKATVVDLATIEHCKFHESSKRIPEELEVRFFVLVSSGFHGTFKLQKLIKMVASNWSSP